MTKVTRRYYSAELLVKIENWTTMLAANSHKETLTINTDGMYRLFNLFRDIKHLMEDADE